jgi:hypothetical protein
LVKHGAPPPPPRTQPRPHHAAGLASPPPPPPSSSLHHPRRQVSYWKRFVTVPRLFLGFDAVMSFTVGLIGGASGALQRLAMAVGFAFVRTALLTEPVLPAVLALHDPAFAAHGAMMKSRFAGVLDPVGLGDGSAV